MIVRALGLFCLLLSLTGRAATAPTLPLQDGEKLTYRVSWAIVPGAGEIKIAATQDNSGPSPRLVVVSDTATRRLARLLLPFEAQSKATFDLKTGQMIALQETSVQRDKKAEHQVTFDYVKREASYIAPEPPGPPRLLAIPPGDPTDLIMGLLQTRSWNLKPGEKRDALVLFDDDFYELTIHMARYEDLETPLGTFRTAVLEPRMDKTAPKGMFKRGSSVRVWIAQDAHRLPVKFEVEFKIGTGTATLEAYEAPPTPAKDAKNSRP
jgi:hypothetical protein